MQLLPYSRVHSAWMAVGDVGTSHMSNILQMSVTTQRLVEQISTARREHSANGKTFFT
jgi:hypothetical protein